MMHMQLGLLDVVVLTEPRKTKHIHIVRYTSGPQPFYEPRTGQRLTIQPLLTKGVGRG